MKLLFWEKFRSFFPGNKKNAGTAFLSLLYPVHCPVCDRLLPFHGEAGACSSCQRDLPWIVQPFCMKCGKMLDDSGREYCGDCFRRPHRYDRGIAVFQYTGSMKRSVRRMKFENRRDSLDFYADCMVSRAQQWLRLWQPDAVIPVPMHWKKKNQRGFNQSELLADKIGQRTGIPVRKDILKKCRNTRNQKELSLEERRKNLEGAFVLKKRPEGLHTVLIVDDIYTTGSTMDAIAAVLKAGGVTHIYFLALCIGKG